jgi:hypothetical protein
MPETGEKAESIRSETPAKPRKRESLQHARARGMLEQSAILPQNKTMLNRRHQLSPSERRSAHFSWREVSRANLPLWEKHKKHDDTV